MASLLGGAIGGGREYVLKIVADVRDAVKGVDEVATKTSSMKSTMLGVGKAVAAGLAAGAVVDFGRASIQAAADADDAMDAISASFGGAGQSIIDFSKTTAERMGMSADQYQMMAAETGNLLKSVGLSADDAAKRTITMSERAADMGAIWGTSTAEAMEAIDKAMMGQTKGLQKFNVKISSAEIEARAMAAGYVDAAGKVTDAGKAIAAQELILEKTANVQGAYAENSKDLGSQQDIMRAKMRDLQAEIGGKLLPIIVQLMQAVQPLLNFIADNIQWLLPLAGIIAGIAAAIKVWTLAQGALNLVMMANPIGLIVAAVAAFIAILVIAYQKVDWFRNAVDAMGRAAVDAFNWVKDAAVTAFNWIKDNWPLLLAILTGPFGAAVAIIVKNWDSIVDFFRGLPEKLGRVLAPVVDAITYPFKVAWNSVEYVAKLITNVWNWVVDSIRWLFGQVWNIITWPFNQAWNAVEYVAKRFVGVWQWFVDSLRWLFGGVYDIITWPFRRAMDAIKWLWNTTIGGFGFTVPSWIPLVGGKGFRIPEMASGGIVTRPTIALIGEAGPEAVIPLSSGTSVPVASAAPVTINVYALTANAEVGRQIWNALREYERVSGRAIA